MKKFNVKDLKVKVEISKVLNALSLKKSFYIGLNGNIFFDDTLDLKTPIVFEYKCNKKVMTNIDLNNIFKDYKINIEENYISINTVFSWQKIISLNKLRMIYFDHQSDGVELFEDIELEEIGWQATACDISYRSLSDFIEANCNGSLVFYENDVQFNGFAIVDDLIDTRTKVKEFIVQKIKEKIEDDLIDLEDEDIIEALEYFKIEV